MIKLRSFLCGLATSATIGTAFLAIWYVFMWPTSDVRTRMYILIGLDPTVPLLVLWAFLTLLGGGVLFATGWRGLWPMLGAVAGATFGVAVLWSRVMGLYAWLYEEQVTISGQLVRASVAAVVAGVVVTWARHQARAGVAA